jgi:hypothetical protein
MIRFMWRDRSTMIPSVSDCPLVPVPPPRGVNTSLANLDSLESFAMRTTSVELRGKTIACGVIW